MKNLTQNQMKIIIILSVLTMWAASPAFAMDLGDVDIHGFVSQGYLQSDKFDFYSTRTSEGSFEFNELGLNFSTAPSDNLRIGAQLLARDLGEIGNDEVGVDWAYGDYQYSNWLGVRAGKIKQPLGLFNQVRDIDATRTCIFLPNSVYSEDYRDTAIAVKGVGLYGLLPGGFEYQATAGVMSIPLNSGPVKQFETQGMTVESVDVDANHALRLMWNTPLDGLRMGATTYTFGIDFNATGIGSVNTAGRYNYGSVQYLQGDLMLAAEYKWSYLSVDIPPFLAPNPFYNPANPLFGPQFINVPRTVIKSIPHGYYAMATYRFTDWFELGGYYSEDWQGVKDLSYTYEIKTVATRLRDWTLSTRFDITDAWCFKMEGHFMNGFYTVDTTGVNNPNSDWFLFAAKTTYSF